MSQILTVTITGPAKSGKSILAQRIATLLRQEGIGAAVTFEDKEMPPDVLQGLEPLATIVLSDTEIVVNMEQLPRGFERMAMTSSERMNARLIDSLLPPSVQAERAAKAAISVGWQEPATA